MATTQVLIRDRPSRAIALRTPTHVLTFRHSPTASTNASTTSLTGQSSAINVSGPKCIVELTPTGRADTKEYRVASRSVHGCLGLITIDNDVFLSVVSGSAKTAVLRPGESVQRIMGVEFYCLNRSTYDHLLNDEINLYPTDTPDEEGYEHGQQQGRRDPALEHPCLALRKLLSGGSFYYSADFDLTNRMQDRERSSNTSFDYDSFDKGYLWNGYMIRPLIDFRSRLSDQERKDLDSTRLLIAAIRGFASTMHVPAPASPARSSRTGVPSTLTLLSRLSCNRAGTRFNARGIDDDGFVANFVETETIFWSPDGICFSYAQIRGSVPLFWEQSPGLLPGQQKVQLTRSPQATQPAFDKHFEALELKYGPIHIVNLLSKEKPGEIEISTRYRNHASRSSLNRREDGKAADEHGLLMETEYDFHAETRAAGYEAASGIRRYIRDSVDSFGYCLTQLMDDEPKEGATLRSTMILQQEGVFRTNCLDCLDRTNLMQTIISQMGLESFLGPRGEHATGDFLARHGSLWADNGDMLSKIYAGTGALKSSFTRSGKMSLAGALADARKSATRMYINNFQDKGRQTVMEMLLGRLIGQNPVYLFDPINDYVTTELEKRASEYTSSRDIRIWAGTFNLNGSSRGLNNDIASWLCPDVEGPQRHPEIVAVGFQEIVELSPQQIMSTDANVRLAWEKSVKRTLNANAKDTSSEEYVLLRGGQLVGASLSIFVKASLLQHVKNVEGSLKKTGMSGMAGNKGAVAIRLEIDNTSICFVTAHLAAGFANYEERNRDYHTINQGLRFQRNRGIDNHDTVIWLGDFNYRIGLSHDKARDYAKAGNVEKLYANDQLNLQMMAGLTFPHYSEARILFKPTYKFDLGSDEYDTSEKARIPAWTDRVLYRGSNLRQIDYDSAPLRFSDHRPVYATFICTVNVVDERVKNEMNRTVYVQRRAQVGSINPREGGSSSDDEDLLDYESVEPGLPPASSSQRKWWLDNGQPARATLEAPSKSHVPNPGRPSNPFKPTSQPDWVLVGHDGPKSIKQPQLPARNISSTTHGALMAPLQPTRSSQMSPAGKEMRLSDRSLSQGSNASSTATGVSAATVVRKPSVPRKPMALSSNPSTPTVEATAKANVWPSTAQSRGNGNGNNNSGAGPTPPPPRRANSRQPSSGLEVRTLPDRLSSARSLIDEQDEAPPALPARQKTTHGLMDDSPVDDPLSAWTPLKPS